MKVFDMILWPIFYRHACRIYRIKTDDALSSETEILCGSKWTKHCTHGAWGVYAPYMVH